MKKTLITILATAVITSLVFMGYVVTVNQTNEDKLNELTTTYEELNSDYEELKSDYEDVCEGVYNMQNDEPYDFTIEYDDMTITYSAKDNSGIIRDAMVLTRF